MKNYDMIMMIMIMIMAAMPVVVGSGNVATVMSQWCCRANGDVPHHPALGGEGRGLGVVELELDDILL